MSSTIMHTASEMLSSVRDTLVRLAGPVLERVEPAGGWPDPTGLFMGLASVAVGQVVTLGYFTLWRAYKGDAYIQKEEKSYGLWEGITTHLAQPEGFVLLGTYLSATWMFRLMPASYYSFEGGICWKHVLMQLLIQDAIQTLMHFGEHKLHPTVYRNSHKPHHRWLNPRLFDAYNGSLGDTVFMILVPLYITANLVHCNVWSYMAFGTIFANYLTLIHSEYEHAWDPLFRALGIGTAADHHVHHKMFIFNYGHIFMYWDMLLGTYKSPDTIGRFTTGKTSAFSRTASFELCQSPPKADPATVSH